MQDTEELKPAASCEARYVKVEGAAGTGKTQVLIDRIAGLIERGVSEDVIVAFAATQTAADEMRNRLEQAIGPNGVTVTTAARYAKRILASEDARRQTGRNPRLLEDFEQRILVEDLKATGIPPKRLREMLKFFYRTYSELGDEGDDFLLSFEERLLAEKLAAHLKAREAMLPHELSNIAAKYLRSGSADAEPWRVDYVLADDFQDASKATQTLIELLSKNQLFITGNPNQMLVTMETYPYRAGFEGFEHDHEGAQTFFLSRNKRSGEGIVAVGNALCDVAGMDGRFVAQAGTEPSQTRIVQWTLPNAEFINVSEYVISRVRGTREPVHPRDVFIAVPNALWGRAFAKVLADSDVKSTTMLSYNALTGDPRDNDKNQSLRLFTALNLVARPGDAAAWRNWCGFGDYLTHSNHWCRLEEYADERGLGVVEALEQISERSEPGREPEPFLGADVLAQAYRTGKAIVSSSQGRKGFSLLNGLDFGMPDELPRGFMELIEPVSGVETAEELYERAVAHTEIQFTDEDAVRIGLPQMAVGQQFDTVIVAGAVDGFYPPFQAFSEKYDEDRRAEIVADARRNLYVASQAARAHLIFSCFARDEAVSATKLGMWVRRIRVVNGKRMGLLSPTCFIDELGDAAPGIDTTL